MKLASISYRGRDLVVTELAPGELVGIASLPGRSAARGAPVNMLDVIQGGEPLRQALLGRYNEAIDGFKRAGELGHFGYTYGVAGRTEEALAELAELERRQSSGTSRRTSSR